MSVQTIPSLECLNTFQVSSAKRQKQNTNIVSAVAISPDQKRVVAVGDCLTHDDYKGRSGFHLWNLDTEEEKNISQVAHAWPHASNVLSMAFSADGSSIALGSSDQNDGSKPVRGRASLSLWPVSGLPDYRVMETSKNAIFSIVSHPTEQSFAALDFQGNITLWHDYYQTGELHKIKSWPAHPERSYCRDEDTGEESEAERFMCRRTALYE